MVVSHEDDCQCDQCMVPLADVPMLVALGVAGTLHERFREEMSPEQFSEIATMVEQWMKKELGKPDDKD